MKTRSGLVLKKHVKYNDYVLRCCQNNKEPYIMDICIRYNSRMNINIQDIDGNTPLHHAVFTRHVDAVAYLI